MRVAPIVAFVHMAVCGYIRVDIKSFTMEVVTNPAWHRQWTESGGTSGTSAPSIQYREEQKLFEETTTTVKQPSDDCRFRFPEQRHVDGILSDMMNQLARMYVKVDAFISRHVMNQTRKLWPAHERRALATRYKLAVDRRGSFFDDLFNNMTTEYSKLFNTSSSLPATGGCPPQDEARGRWRELLQHSAGRLTGAVRACVPLCLAERGVEPSSRLAQQVERHVTRELRQVAARQLRALCDNFYLCYQDEFLQSDTRLY